MPTRLVARIFLLIAIALWGRLAFADDKACHLSTSTRAIDYGVFSREDMRPGRWDGLGVTQKWFMSGSPEIQVMVYCTTPHRIRLFVDGVARKHHVFRFTSGGGLTLKAYNARMNKKPVALSPVVRGQGRAQGGNAMMMITPGKGIAATFGSEVAGNDFVVTLDVTSYLSSAAFLAREQRWLEETLRLSVETIRMP